MPDLGKYADAVLSSYAVSIVLLVVLVGLSWRRSIKMKNALEQIEGERKSDG